MSTQMASMRPAEQCEGSNGSTFLPARYLCFGAFHLDLKKEELFRDGIRVKLHGKVYQALVALLQKPGQLLTREELRMQLWPSDTHVNYDANVNTTVNKLRQILGDSTEQPVFVETIPRKGYSFVAKIERTVQPPMLQPARTEKRAPAPTDQQRAETKARFFQPKLLSPWFALGVVILVVASMLFGAALVLYAHR
jgi:DNA-binding winged helix-turn-helix (wHTH) protein